MKIKYTLIYFLLIILTGCNSSDGTNDATIDYSLGREAMCVIASERFNLYKEAQKHFEHGLEFGRIKYETTGQPNNFPQGLYTTRIKMIEKSKEFSAEVLSSMCNRPLTMVEFNQAQ